jgi:hypothetical protein
MPLPRLLDAQGMKSTRRRRRVAVKRRGVWGTQAAVEQVLSACGWQMNTSFMERLNLDIRQHVAAVGRRVTTLCQGAAGVRQQLAVSHVYSNFVLPHTRLRPLLAAPEPTNGSGSATQWRPGTPALAAGVTDRVWSRRDVRLSRVPPWPQPQSVEAAGEGAHRGGERAQVRPQPGEEGGIRLLAPGVERPRPAGAPDATGAGRVHLHYPQRPGTRPSGKVRIYHYPYAVDIWYMCRHNGYT